MDQLIYWIQERYKILTLKEQGLPPPWSGDPVFQTTYFCNVRREDDKVTRWVRENGKYDTTMLVPLNLMVARFVNKIETLKELGWPYKVWNEEEQLDFTHTMNQSGKWGSAYIVSTNGLRCRKGSYVGELISRAKPILAEKLVGGDFGGTLHRAHRSLMTVGGLASFMAGQIVADMKNTEGFPLQEASDWWDWSAPGPGSLRGLKWVYGHRVTPSTYKKHMNGIRPLLESKWPEGVPKVCEQDLQNCLCEFDKYMRVLNNEGRSKRKYDGR